MSRGPVLRLRRALEQALRAGHPWIYADALEGRASPGEVVTVEGKRGRFVARGLADAGPIGVRVLTTRDEPVDEALVTRRVRRAVELRDRVVPAGTDAYRLVHGEGDRLAGLVVDVYGAHAVVRFDGDACAAFWEPRLGPVEDALRKRGVETLIARSGRGTAREATARWGALPSAPIEVREHGMILRADLVHGQKTGLFLDHRESRRRVRELARGMRVLNLYGYTGGFSIAAGLGGAASATTVDVAEGALALARESWARNGLDPAAHAAERADVPAWLAERARSGAAYDLIVSDPPSFAPNEASLEAALASYEQLHASALAILAPGGLYVAASCSSHVEREAFDRTLTSGASRAGRVLQILERSGAPADHPRLAAFPEGDYLKVVVARVLD